MKFTIIPDDGFVSIDGVGYANLTLQVDPSIHAVQWYGEFGEVEYRSVFDGGIMTKPQNEVITDSARFQSVLDVWSLAHEEHEKALAEALARAEVVKPPEPTV